MVFFLLHNTLGAWWAGKVLSKCPELATGAKSENELRESCKVGEVEWNYLRFVRDNSKDGGEGPWRPAAGTFEGWPKAAKDITLLDPCMGSGHFLAAALPILTAFRKAEEGLDDEAAVDAVVRDNLFGLEIDPRCTQIAAFNLAFVAWRRTGFHELPQLNIACSGLSTGVTKAEWLKLAEKAVTAADPEAKRNLFGVEENLFTVGMEKRVKNGLEGLFDLFAKAPWLGSLIDPSRADADIFREGFDKLAPLLESILTTADTDEVREIAVAAQGMAKTAELLGSSFSLIVTNLPYLGAKKQHGVLSGYTKEHYPSGKADLATSFLVRLKSLLNTGGTLCAVTPQNWLFLGTYSHLRREFLRNFTWPAIIFLGSGAFESISGEVVNVAFFLMTLSKPSNQHYISALDVAYCEGPEKNSALLIETIQLELQRSILGNLDSRVAFGVDKSHAPLEKWAISMRGIVSGDRDRWVRKFWEIDRITSGWMPLQSTVSQPTSYGGREHIIDWRTEGIGMLRPGTKNEAYRNAGVAIAQMGSFPATIYSGELYDNNTGTIVPKSKSDLTALYLFCRSPEFRSEVRKIDRKMNVTNATFLKVPIDIEHWRTKAKEEFLKGIPKPFTSDPTQWLFCGQPDKSDSPLLVAVSVLGGYGWPRQRGSDFLDCPALRPDGLAEYTDDDGIVCLTALKGEVPAEQRLNALFAAAYGSDWSAAKLSGLLADIGCPGKSLDDWLRDGFFAQHCDLFHNRPFIWHIWDGRRDGFHALVNYHRLSAPNGEGRRTLEKLIYSYLGDWIERQRADQKAGVEGADARLAHAEHLRRELAKIREGEPPYDLFVRWKPLHQQPIGWEPDINDGVRINIRPFMTARPLGARRASACILRATPNIKWTQDRGTEPMRDKENYPWFWGWIETTPDFVGEAQFDGKRWNDLHYSNAFKQAARARHAAKGEGKT